MVRVLLIWMGLLCAPLAWAAPVQLPGGEAVADWSAAFAMAGLSLGPPGGDEGWVVLSDVGEGWLLRVEDRSGRVHELPVDRPTTAQEREDLVWLSVSLLHPAARPSRWEPTPAPRPSPAPAPEPVLEADPAPEPEPEPEASPTPRRPPGPMPDPAPEPERGPAPEPEPDSEPTPEPAPEPTPRSDPLPDPDPEPTPAPAAAATPELPPAPADPSLAPAWDGRKVRVWLTLGNAVTVPIASTPSVEFRLDSGLDFRNRFRVGLGLGGTAPSYFYVPYGSDRVSSTEFHAMAYGTLGPKRRLLLGGGAGFRLFQIEGDGGGEQFNVNGTSISIPGVGSTEFISSLNLRLEARLAFRVAEWLSLSPWVALSFDLYDFSETLGSFHPLAPVEARIGISLTTMRHVGRGAPFPVVRKKK